MDSNIIHNIFAMKTLLKFVFVAALIGCIIPSSAQQSRNEPKEIWSLKDRIRHVEQQNRHENQFTQKLDSVTWGDMRILYEYDARLNCIKESRNKPNWNETMENTYDELNRLTSVTHQQLSSIYRIVYAYNEQSLVKEEIYSYLSGDVWEQYEKRTYDYDGEGNVAVSVVFNYSDGWTKYSKLDCEYENGLLQNEMYHRFIDGDWQPYYNTEYSYNDQGLCTLVVSSTWNGEWSYSSKTEYEYSEYGLCIDMVIYSYLHSYDWKIESRYSFEYDCADKCLSVISYNHYNGSQEWVYDYKTEYIFDANGNCTTYSIFDYSGSGFWQLEDVYEMTYDSTVSVEQTAGLSRFWESMGVDIPIPIINPYMDVNIPIYNKLLQFNITKDDEEDCLVVCHYSDYNSINEPTERLIAVWPNPATKAVRIEGCEHAEVQIFNALGQLVKTMRDTNEIELEGLSKGVYLFKVTDTDRRIHMAKVMVK